MPNAGVYWFCTPMSGETVSAAVERALGILETLAAVPAGLTHSEISRRLEIPKSTATYLLRSLERRGYLRREGTRGKYHLGLKVLGLHRSALAGLEIRELAQPLLQALVERTQLTVHLAVLYHDQAIYVEKAEAAGFVRMDTWVGRRMDVHCTSVGKALVAFRPQAEVETLLRRRGMARNTPRTITSPARLLRELAEVRARGYAVDDEENSLGVRCLAAPVFDAAGAVVAAVGVTGTTAQVSKTTQARIAEQMQEAARKLSRQLGYHPPPAPRRRG